MTPLERAGWCFFVRCPREGTFGPADKSIDIACGIAAAKLARILNCRRASIVIDDGQLPADGLPNSQNLPSLSTTRVASASGVVGI
jgi:hypothetical protein